MMCSKRAASHRRRPAGMWYPPKCLRDPPGHQMRRRELIGVLARAAIAAPLPLCAQQSDRMRRIGLLIGPTEEHDPESLARITAFRQGLEALGWTEGRNIRIDYRFGGGDAARIQTYAAELVKTVPDVIVANSSPVVVALKNATSTIPIVFAAVN